jgi:transposase
VPTAAMAMASLSMTAKLNGGDPLAWLAVLSRIAELPQSHLQELLPWHWAAKMEHRKVPA